MYVKGQLDETNVMREQQNRRHSYANI